MGNQIDGARWERFDEGAEEGDDGQNQIIVGQGW